MKVRARAPLRLGFAGGGTDLSPYCDQHGGLVLNATIDLYAYATITPAARPVIRFAATDQQVEAEYPLQPVVPADGPLRLHQGVYNRIVREFRGGEPLAVELVTASDAPAGSGLGASSTLVVAMISAFAELLGLPLGEYDIARLAYEIERIDLGLPGGRQDQYAAAFGGVNFIEFHPGDHIVVNPLRIKSWVLSEIEASTVLYYTGVARESGRIIMEQTDRITRDDPAAVTALHEIKEEARHMKECVLRGDLARFARSMRKGWDAKQRTASSVSTNVVDRALAVAMEAGASAGKVSGAGGGGFLMLFVDPVRRGDVGRALRALDEGELFNCHFTRHGSKAWRVP
ncbi:MAG: dehydrogenase [Burkholderiales bacterium]